MRKYFSKKTDLANIIRVGILLGPIATFAGQLMMSNGVSFLVKMHSVVLRQQ